MARPPRDALRPEILEVSQRLFSTIGYRATSLQMIADEVGCSKASLLYHFHGKAALLRDLVQDLLDDVARMRALLDPGSQWATRAGAVELAIGLVVRHRRAIAMLRGLDDLAELAPLVERGDAVSRRARELLVGADPEPTDLVATAVFEHGVLGACLDTGDVTDDELTAALLGIASRLFDLPPIPDHHPDHPDHSRIDQEHPWPPSSTAPGVWRSGVAASSSPSGCWCSSP